jgi:spermidine synthase
MRLPPSSFFSIALLGWVVATGQTILLREAVAVSQGNEISIALALGQWLLLTAAGSALAGVTTRRLARPFLQICAVLSGPSLLVALLSARILPRFFGVLPGALLSLDQQVMGLCLALAPVCLLGGAIFTLATRLQGVAASSVYLAEALGWLAGGATTTWLVPTWEPVLVFAFLTVGAVTAAVMLSAPRRAWLSILLGLVVAVGHARLAAVDRLSLAWRWPGEILVTSAYTRHGHAAVLARAGVHTLFVDGHLSLVLPELQSSEELVHLGLAQVTAPRRVFVWSGLGGQVPEILKHPVEEVIVAEPDATLARLQIEAADPATRAALRDPRVHLEIGDLRSLMRRSPLSFDAVLLTTAEPSTLLAARVLTEESFGEVARALRPGGVLAFPLSGAENYYPAELVARNGAVWKALATHFAHVVATPLSTNIFLASQSPLQIEATTLARRLASRNVTGAFIDEAGLEALLPDLRMQELETRYRTSSVLAASDRQPTAYRHSLAIAGRADGGALARLVPRLIAVTLWPLAGLAALGLVVVGILGRRRKAPDTLGVFTIGFSSMGSMVLILEVAQSAVGALHQFLGALVAAHMAGMAVAGWAPWPRPRFTLAWVPGLAVTALIPLLSRASPFVPAPATVAALLLVSLLAGLAVGAAFRSALGQGVGPVTAYGADLVGAALAAPTMAVVALPNLGLDASSGLLAFFVITAMALKIGTSARLPM